MCIFLLSFSFNSLRSAIVQRKYMISEFEKHYVYFSWRIQTNEAAMGAAENPLQRFGGLSVLQHEKYPNGEQFLGTACQDLLSGFSFRTVSWLIYSFSCQPII